MSVISVRNLGVRYTIHRAATGKSLKRSIFQFVSGEFRREQFWALRGVTFDIDDGDVLGIVGSNGAGKSTLCLALAQILVPDEGEVTVRGAVAPILSLGAGFNRDMTGRENVRLSGALMLLSPQQIRELEPSVVAFAELDDFIDNPARTYSSGMRARLAFSIATSIEADVLILDEVLGVGDAYFRKKSEERMRQLMERARAIVLVSHSAETIRNLCTTALWLNKGEIKAHGSTENVLGEYERWQQARRARKKSA